jgi:hypothetical protein
MTSQVNPNNIDGTYPVAGQDNDSQGFRDNFTNIRNNLTYVKAEIEDLQTKAVLKSALLNSTLDNDFVGNAIVNPSFTSWRETYNNIGAASGAVTINFANGNFQKITMSGSTTLTFSWPSNTANQYVSIKLWVSNPNSAYTLTLPTSCTLGDPDTIAGLSGTSPPIITFNASEIANNTEYLFEFFTVDGGTTIGIKDLIRNRDVDLSGFSISGNVSLDALTATGNVLLGSSINSTVGSNVVVRSNVGATSTTTGALVVAGGAGVAGNLVIGSNIVTTGGRINPNYAYVTLVDNQNYFANISYQTLYFDTASSATIANARIALPGSAIDGREINMSFLAPITALWVNSGNTAAVKWFPNTSVGSGNVSVKFVYSAGQATWLKSA